MIKKILIIMIVFSFFAVSPIFAVQKKDKQSVDAKNQTSEKKADGVSERKNDNPPPPVVKSENPPEKKKDRFIDNNDDGINDDYKKVPKVKVKKKNTEKNDDKSIKRR